MAFVVTSYTFESLLTSAKMQIMMENDTLLRSFSVGSHEGYHFSATASGHTHNGSDSAIITKAIGYLDLKTSDGTVSRGSSGTSNLVLPGGYYGFYPKVKVDGGGITMQAAIATSVSTLSYVANIALTHDGGAAGNAVARQFYIQASPPYKIGNTSWGHFLFILRDKISGETIAAYEAEDPPWASSKIGEKDSSERIETIPHPFLDCYDNLPANHEICMLNLKDSNVEKWKKDLNNRGKSILEDLSRINLTKIQTFSEFNLSPNIKGFSNKVTIRKGSLK